MKKLIIQNKILLLIFFIIFTYSKHSNAGTIHNIKLGTGTISGIYYPAGSAICKIYNHNKISNETRCIAIPSQGSIENLENLKNNKFSFAIIQSDIESDSFHKKNQFQGLKNEKIRTVLFLQDESLGLLVRENSNIKTFEDILTTRINIGNENSGSRYSFNKLLNFLGYSYNDFAKVTNYTNYEQADKLCKNEIDVAIYFIGYPNATINEGSKICKTRIIPIDGPKIDEFLNNNPEYSKIIISQEHDNEIKTIGVKAILATYEDIDRKIVYDLTKYIAKNIDEFKKLHPSFANIDIHPIIHEGNYPPYHEGVIDYFNEKE